PTLHDPARLERARGRDGPRVGQVEGRRERCAVGQPRCRLDHEGPPAHAARRDLDHTTRGPPELGVQLGKVPLGDLGAARVGLAHAPSWVAGAPSAASSSVSSSAASGSAPSSAVPSSVVVASTPGPSPPAALTDSQLLSNPGTSLAGTRMPDDGVSGSGAPSASGAICTTSGSTTR